MQDKNYYELIFSAYPDVVTTKDLRVMLGGACEKTVLSLLRQNVIQHFRIGAVYHIPKVSVIEYMVSEEYLAFRRRIEYAKIKATDDLIKKAQLKMLNLCETPKTRKELMYMVDVESIKSFKRLHLNPLLESGRLRMAIPNQPSLISKRPIFLHYIFFMFGTDTQSISAFSIYGRYTVCIIFEHNPYS